MHAAMGRGRDYVTRDELVETIKERFRKIEEINSGNDPTEGGGAVGPSSEWDGGRWEPSAGDVPAGSAALAQHDHGRLASPARDTSGDIHLALDEVGRA